MKILGISGSPRIKNTDYMLRTVLDATGADYSLVNLKDLKINSCLACKRCQESCKCVVEDGMNDLYQQILAADCIVLGSPVYFDNVSGVMKNFMDRCLPFYLSGELKNKKVALVAVGNYRGGEELKGNRDINENIEVGSVKKCLEAMENFCFHLGLKVIGSVLAVRGNPREKESQLKELGEKLFA